MRKILRDFQVIVSFTASPSQLERDPQRPWHRGSILKWPLQKCAQLDEQCAFGEMLPLCEELEKIEGSSKWSCLQLGYKVQIVSMDQGWAWVALMERLMKTLLQRILINPAKAAHISELFSTESLFHRSVKPVNGYLNLTFYLCTLHNCLNNY